MTRPLLLIVLLSLLDDGRATTITCRADRIITIPPGSAPSLKRGPPAWRQLSRSTGQPARSAEEPLVFLASSSRIVNLEDDPLDRDAAEESSPRAVSSYWPPWPFNMISSLKRDNLPDESYPEGGVRSWKSTASLLWSFSNTKSRVAMRNCQEVGSMLWFHFPPASPPLMLLASIPRKQKLEGTALEEMIYKTVIPLWSNSFVRNLALSGAGLAIVSWAHSELQRRRRLTPLALADRYKDLNRALLPPFLPEEIHVAFIEDDDDDEEEETVEETTDEDPNDALPLRLHRQWKQFARKAPRSVSAGKHIQEWRQMRRRRLCERNNAHRLAVMDELIALQTLKQKARQQRGSHYGKRGTHAGSDVSANKDDRNSLGYALVTGASKGIGRAIAVELARWEVPLILVARDTNALTALAFDLHACYGVDCFVLPADLSKPNTAENIYKTVQQAGLTVDILVNNAGLSSHGESLDLSIDDVQRMIQVNSVSTTILTQLFGRDMRDRARGRILMVSSICGAVAGIANVAVYSATKAFENSFGISIGKELEPYGVGVTCMMPGAVHGTEFKSVSQSQDALCWKLPFYSKSAQFVADCGVRAMLRGETEVTPGFMNRVFLKVLKPILPQRLHNLAAEIAWSPLKPPFGKKPETLKSKLDVSHRSLAGVQRTHRFLMSQPKLLELQEEKNSKEGTPLVAPVEKSSESNFDLPEATRTPQNSDANEDTVHEESFPTATEAIAKRREDVASAQNDHTSSNHTLGEADESFWQERQSSHQGILVPDNSKVQSSSAPENPNAQSSAPDMSNTGSSASGFSREQLSAHERPDSPQQLAPRWPASRSSASSTTKTAQPAGTTNTGLAQSTVAPHPTPRVNGSLDSVSSFLRTWLRGEDDAPPGPDLPASETAPNDNCSTCEFSLSAAELALKEFEKANDPTSTMFEKTLVK